jgi:hypothetical protein
LIVVVEGVTIVICHVSIRHVFVVIFGVGVKLVVRVEVVVATVLPVSRLASDD